MKLTPDEEVSLKEDNMLWAMAETDGWKTLLRPFMMTKMNQSFPDPSQFTKEEEFLYAAKTSSIFKKVIAELLQFVDTKVEEAKVLEEKKRSRKKDAFAIGGD